MTRPSSKWGLAAAALLVLAAAGCASGPIPTDRLTNSGAAISRAQEAGASNVPEAKLHLKLAQDQYEQAKKLVADGENNRAAMVLMRAEADAELAHALAREHSLKLEAKQAEEKLRAIQQ